MRAVAVPQLPEPDDSEKHQIGKKQRCHRWSAIDEIVECADRGPPKVAHGVKHESPEAYTSLKEQNRSANVDKQTRDPHDQRNTKKADRDGTGRDGYPFDGEKECVPRMVSEAKNEIANKPSHGE